MQWLIKGSKDFKKAKNVLAFQSKESSSEQSFDPCFRGSQPRRLARSRVSQEDICKFDGNRCC